MLRLASYLVFERIGFVTNLDQFLYPGFLRFLSDGEHLLLVMASNTELVLATRMKVNDGGSSSTLIPLCLGWSC